MSNMILKQTGFLAGSVAVLAIATSVSLGQDFSGGSKAKEWGLSEEELATFSGKVVDVLCELSGDCPDNCGDGKRNLGIVRDADGKLVMVLKNGQAAFNGATDDLLPYCNRQVDVDGLLIADPEEFGAKFYMVQYIRENGATEWNKARLWTAAWKKRNPEAVGKGPWFRRDPRVRAQIEKDGYFGLGAETDEAYRKENE